MSERQTNGMFELMEGDRITRYRSEGWRKSQKRPSRAIVGERAAKQIVRRTRYKREAKEEVREAWEGE